MKSEDRKTISLRLDQEYLVQLEKEAEENRIGIGVYLRVYIETMIDKYGLISFSEKRAS